MLSPYHLRGVKLTQRENQLGERAGGRAHLRRWLSWPLKNQAGGLQGTQHTPSPTFRNEPISSFAVDLSIQVASRGTLLFATILCSGKTTIEKCKARAWQQLLCGRASLPMSSGNLGRTAVHWGGGWGERQAEEHTETRSACFCLLIHLHSHRQNSLRRPPNYQHKPLWSPQIGGGGWGTFSFSKILNRIQPPHWKCTKNKQNQMSQAQWVATTSERSSCWHLPGYAAVGSGWSLVLNY